MLVSGMVILLDTRLWVSPCNREMRDSAQSLKKD